MPWDIKLPFLVATVVVMALLGPFGTYEASDFWGRLVFWSLLFIGIGGLMHLSITTARATPLLGPLPWYGRALVGAAIAAVPSTAIVFFVDALMLPPAIAFSSFPTVLTQVAAIGGAIALLESTPIWRRLVRRTGGRQAPPGSEVQPSEAPGPDEEPAPPEPAAGAPNPPQRTLLHRRLPPELGDDIVSVSMQDHYAAVTTTRGTHLLLMRLRDVLGELEGLPGVQLHRSHWAALSHIAGLERRGRRLIARLDDGRELPVSAGHARHVIAALTSAGISTG